MHRKLIVFLFLWVSTFCYAQFNTDRLLTIGRSALYYEDYVLSMQYFNQAISAKPYLYEPWFFRGVAKYYLDDYIGAESDCSEALQRNPYVVNIYELRALTRIQQKKYADAIRDYTTALVYEPENRGLWHNRVLCYLRSENYQKALEDLDTMIIHWQHYAPVYNMQADAFMQMKDTAKAVASLDKSLEIDPYDGSTWAAKSIISLSREAWEEGEEYLNKAIHLLPKNSTLYVNRALARVNQNDLRGAMADYDMALDISPNNFLGHYNRGLLRAQVGDDNRAITDFDFVLRLEPDNMMALFNRAVLLDHTGDLRGAIRDYSRVIEEYPNFWTGLEYRADCYRRLGMKKQAEQDEFTVYKARLDKHLYGKQPRLKPHQMRKRSDEDLDKYNQLVIEDEQELEHEYQSDYRGRVQNHKVAIEFQPMFGLTFEPMQSDVRLNTVYQDHLVEQFNQQHHGHRLFINNTQKTLSERASMRYFSLIDSLTVVIAQTRDTHHAVETVLMRGIAFSIIQNNEGAIDDFSVYLAEDSLSVLALWQRAVCQARINRFEASEGTNVELKTANVMGDFNHALSLSPDNPYLLYNRGCLYASRAEYGKAIHDFTRAIEMEPALAEAYFNRGLCYFYGNQQEKGVRDLSKAGEMGLYTAYSIIKKYRIK